MLNSINSLDELVIQKILQFLNLKDLKYAHQNGSIGLWVDDGTTAYFRNLTIAKSTATTPFAFPSVLNINSNGFFPEDVQFYNGSAYVTGFGNGSLQKFDFSSANPTAQQIAAATDATKHLHVLRTHIGRPSTRLA